ncbi:macro domain-containing protein [Nocardia asiatica]
MAAATDIRYTRGDATAPHGARPAVIAHIVNDRGAWGRGFVLAVSRRWPEPERAYRAWHRGRESNDFALGALQLVRVEPQLWVANMIGQHGIATRRSARPPIRYDATGRCLEALADHAAAAGASVHLPRIGCGLAGGRWEQIEPLIRTHLCTRGIPVTIYDLP